jgi:hypothetical protein
VPRDEAKITVLSLAVIGRLASNGAAAAIAMCFPLFQRAV